MFVDIVQSCWSSTHIQSAVSHEEGRYPYYANVGA